MTRLALIAITLFALASPVCAHDAIVMRHLVVVYQLSGCDTDASCERLARDLGCTMTTLDAPLSDDDETTKTLFVCDKATLESKLSPDQLIEY